jgi:hypothetical protein
VLWGGLLFFDSHFIRCSVVIVSALIGRRMVHSARLCALDTAYSLSGPLIPILSLIAPPSTYPNLPA